MEKVQVPLAGTMPPLCANEVAPAATVAGVNPVQPLPVTVTAPPVAVSPAGSASVKAEAGSATALGFCAMMLSCVVPPAFTLTGLKPMLITAGCRTVTSSAVEEAGL